MSSPFFRQALEDKGFFWRQENLFGKEAQERLQEVKVLIVGLGGLGSCVAETLVRLGIGGLYLMDPGVVNLPDLNRQILYSQKDIGRSKTEAACERLSHIRPDVGLFPIPEPITRDFVPYDDTIGVVDCLDNFQDRFTLDEICQEQGLFLVHGGLDGLFGQVTTLLPHTRPRLRALFQGAKEPELPPPAAAPICMAMASIQALEVVNQVIGKDDSDTLVGKLLLLDLAGYRMDILNLQVDKDQ